MDTQKITITPIKYVLYADNEFCVCVNSVEFKYIFIMKSYTQGTQ